MATAEALNIRVEPLPEPTPAERMREEMVAWDAVFRQAFRLPPYNPDSLLGSRGFETYDMMMTDAQIRASINTKRYALLARPWQVFPAIQDRADSRYASAVEARDFGRLSEDESDDEAE